ncbi:MAG: hypothetical protein JW778_02655 [Candidatus Altiarchaeota archaeon]|nr:hypothetical protein [Candidatus Altiarchaeota archaeon]
MDWRVFSVLFLIFLCGCVWDSSIDSDLTISQDVIDLCEVEGKIVCHGDCVDGFGSDCFFDSTEYSRDELSTGISFPEETLEACFAVHSFSVCGSCHNFFELRENDGFVRVSCGEFFQTIKNKNTSCNGCIDMIQSGCC